MQYYLPAKIAASFNKFIRSAQKKSLFYFYGIIYEAVLEHNSSKHLT